jgi:type IV secretory pathway TrbF-like protein
MVVSEPAETPRKATPLQVAKAVASAFIGIRRRAAHERDVVTVTPLQVVVAGVIGAILFVSGLVLLVRFITS